MWRSKAQHCRVHLMQVMQILFVAVSTVYLSSLNCLQVFLPIHIQHASTYYISGTMKHWKEALEAFFKTVLTIRPYSKYCTIHFSVKHSRKSYASCMIVRFTFSRAFIFVLVEFLYAYNTRYLSCHLNLVQPKLFKRLNILSPMHWQLFNVCSGNIYIYMIYGRSKSSACHFVLKIGQSHSTHLEGAALLDLGGELHHQTCVGPVQSLCWPVPGWRHSYPKWSGTQKKPTRSTSRLGFVLLQIERLSYHRISFVIPFPYMFPFSWSL